MRTSNVGYIGLIYLGLMNELNVHLGYRMFNKNIRIVEARC